MKLAACCSEGTSIDMYENVESAATATESASLKSTGFVELIQQFGGFGAEV